MYESFPPVTSMNWEKSAARNLEVWRYHHSLPIKSGLWGWVGPVSFAYKGACGVWLEGAIFPLAALSTINTYIVRNRITSVLLQSRSRQRLHPIPSDNEKSHVPGIVVFLIWLRLPVVFFPVCSHVQNELRELSRLEGDDVSCHPDSEVEIWVTAFSLFNSPQPRSCSTRPVNIGRTYTCAGFRCSWCVASQSRSRDIPKSKCQYLQAGKFE